MKRNEDTLIIHPESPEFMTHSASSGACMAQHRMAGGSRQGHRHVLSCLWQQYLEHYADHDAMGIFICCLLRFSSDVVTYVGFPVWTFTYLLKQEAAYHHLCAVRMQPFACYVMLYSNCCVFALVSHLQLQ